MKDLVNPKWMYLKGVLFLLLGSFATVILLLDSPTLRTGILLALAIWCFCRAYYFAFYVIEKYVDKEFKFSGLGNFLAYLLRSRK